GTRPTAGGARSLSCRGRRCKPMRGIGFILVLLAALVPGAEAFAHASLIRSEPPDRAVVAQAPSILVLTFNEPVSPLVVRLVRPTGEATELKDVVANDARLTIPLPEGLTVGTYLLSWRVISTDGHPVGGALTFSVVHRSERPPTSEVDLNHRLRWTILAAKLMLYVDLCVGICGTFYAAWIAIEPQSLRTRTLTATTLACGFLAAVMSHRCARLAALRGERAASLDERPCNLIRP